MEDNIRILLKEKNYEDLLLLYVFNYNRLKPFPLFIETLNKEDRTNLLLLILKARTPSSINLRKIMLSRYFYEVLQLDNLLQNKEL